jgi:hypothetical protein
MGAPATSPVQSRTTLCRLLATGRMKRRRGLLPTVSFQQPAQSRPYPASQHCEHHERRLQPAVKVSVELLRWP